MRIIGLTGPKLSGKGTAADCIISKTGAVRYSMSGIIADILDRLHLEQSRANLIAAITGLRSQFGDDILARVLADDIRAVKDNWIIIDGIRMPGEVTIFSTLPGFELWYIDAPLDTRYERTKTRGEKVGESSMTKADFIAEEAAPTEVNIRSLQPRADWIVDNASSVADFYTRLTDHLSHHEQAA